MAVSWKRTLFVVLTLVGLLVVGKPVLSADTTNQSKKRFLLLTPYKSPLAIAALAAQLERRDFDVAGSVWKRGIIEVITTEQGADYLRKQGFTVRERLPMPGQLRGVDEKYLNPQRLEERLRLGCPLGYEC